MSTTSLTADGVVREYAEEPSENRVLCSRCYEPVYFVAGLVGPARWKHARTHDHNCSPLCRDCGQPARHKVLKYGYFSHWECDPCSSKTFRIERT